jgi:hypothetical protein
MTETTDKANVTKELSEKEIFTKVVNHASKNERVAWNRKRKKLASMIDENITPLEDQILELTMQKQLHMDEIVELRDVLVVECVHPRDCLVTKDTHVLCHFCEKRINVKVPHTAVAIG